MTNGLTTLCGVVIDGKPLEMFSGCALLDYSVGETVIKNSTFLGINRTSPELLQATFGQRQLALTIVFSGETLHAAKMNRTIFNGAVFGAVEIFIPDDGFTYAAVCDSLGAEELVGIGDAEAKIKATYSFTAFRRDALTIVEMPAGGAVHCRSTVPFTDCRLTVTVGADADMYQLGGAVFENVSAGDVLIFDGIDKIITKNGANAAAAVSWVDFPRLVPGMNRNDAPDTVRVEYYPTFI